MSDACLFILDVGHGNSAVLVDGSGVVVIDAGPGTALLEFLTKEKITRIDALLISHADRDHIKGVISLLESGIEIGEVCLNTDSQKGTATWDDLAYELWCANTKGKLKFTVQLTTNDTKRFNQGNVDIQVLAPTPYLAAKGPGSNDRAGRRLTSNSLSAVVRLTLRLEPVVVLFGDIDEVGLINMVEAKTDMQARIAVFPHHGGKPGNDTDSTAFTGQICKAVIPDVVVFSNGRGEHTSPRHEIVKTILEVLPKARVMCTQLSLNCATETPTKDSSHLTPRFARGREKRKCCAGTIHIELSEKGIRVLPEENPHKAFIKIAATKPLCLDM